MAMASGYSANALAATASRWAPSFQVNTYTTNGQDGAAVASDAAGNFVVLWASPHDGGNLGVFGQRFAPRPGATAPALSHVVVSAVGGLLAVLGWHRLRRRRGSTGGQPHA